MLPWFKKGVTKGVKEHVEPAIHMGIYLFMKRIAKETPNVTAIEILESLKVNLPEKIIKDAERLEAQ